ncbi:hypothetical protein HWV62_5925, partial [Athelia sp. TMB]
MLSVRSVAHSISRTQGSFSHFSTSLNLRDNRAFIFESTGTPSTVVRAVSYPSLSDPAPNTVNVKYLLSPINPSDINRIEGFHLYPRISSATTLGECSDVFVAGSEGLAEIMAVGSGVKGIKKGDRVVMLKEQLGTWRSQANVQVEDIIQIPEGASEVGAATITINPPTAYNMLSDFVDLKEGDWIIQNGANSAVGQAVIQIAATRGVKTINLVRSRSEGLNLGAIKKELYGLGATQVATYDDIAHRSFRETVREWTRGNVSTSSSLALSGSLTHGGWYAERTRVEREQLMHNLVGLMKDGKLKNPMHEILTIGEDEEDLGASRKLQAVLREMVK